MLDIHVQPRASRSEVVGWHGDSVKVRLQSPPVDGAANDELVRFLAARMGLAPTAVRIVRGSSGRRKRLLCEGVTRAEALRALGLADTSVFRSPGLD